MKYKLLVAILFISQLSFGQSIITLINKSNEFFDLLDQNKVEDVRAMFDPSVSAKVTPDMLKQFWTGVKQEYGDFQSAGRILYGSSRM
jgi:hypothetical protein